MTTESPAIDRDKSPLLDADQDAVRIAEALLGSPHILGAHAEPGSDRITFTTLGGTGFDLTLQDAEPTTDDVLPAPTLTEALGAAILNHPAFCVATPDSPREDTITVQTKDGACYLLALDVDPDADTGDTPPRLKTSPTPLTGCSPATRATPTAPWPNSSTTSPPPGRSRTSRCASTPRPSPAPCPGRRGSVHDRIHGQSARVP